ncbi:MAG: 3-phosphoshikimate 1-carboxyvinyltransferase [Chlamydiia bacterium]|nr:3-phosphoshikimate 1-carboxyvinyltransferase [Chlamydiia bacterium]
MDKITIPSSKSHTMRALFFALLARGKSVIFSPLNSPDVCAMCRAISSFGAKVEYFPGRIEVRGGRIEGAEDVIDAGNSGQIYRFMAAFAALSSKPVVITGDASIRHNRIITPLLEALNQLGVKAYSLRGDGGAPIFVQGPIRGDHAVISSPDSQPVSALLMTLPFVPHSTKLFVPEVGEKPWIDFTLSWLDRLGLSYQWTDHFYFRGKEKLEGFTTHISGDFSSALFPLVAALLTNKEIEIENLDFTDPQGDKEVLTVLTKMGAHLETTKTSVVVKKGGELRGIFLNVNPFIDAFPILAVLGCFAKGTTHLYGGGVAAKKESDRISTIWQELVKMGACIEKQKDGLLIRESTLVGCEVDSHSDHRIALALLLASLRAKGKTTVLGTECIKKSYPHHELDFNRFS